MRFINKYADKVYRYLYRHDGETLLLKNIARDTEISRPTVRKYLRWLERRGYIKKDGKQFSIVPS